MKSLLNSTLAILLLSFATSAHPTTAFKLELGPPTKSADLSGQCPRYKVTNKPALVPRFKCRFS
jgi:hypothetical protein